MNIYKKAAVTIIAKCGLSREKRKPFWKMFGPKTGENNAK
jgi:hypothetical protein